MSQAWAEPFWPIRQGFFPSVHKPWWHHLAAYKARDDGVTRFLSGRRLCLNSPGNDPLFCPTQLVTNRSWWMKTPGPLCLGWDIQGMFILPPVVLSGPKSQSTTVIPGSICVCVLSHVWFFVASWTVARQAPLSMEFSRQEYWSGVPFPTLGDLPDPGIKFECFALAGRFFTTRAT